MQTILGAGGSIGTELAKELTAYTRHIRLVSRSPQKINDTDELLAADLTRKEEVEKSVNGSEIVYLTVGLQYNTKVWQQQWPVLMKNVIEACKKQGAKLVFFDNVYMYDKDHLQHMTEETPVNPVSKKGAVRAGIAHLLLDETKRGNLTALIVRAADFIGLKNSVLIETVAKNLIKGKKANWFAHASKLHNFTYVPDAAKATALLGNTPDTYNQVWHLPTDKTPLTGKDWITLFANEIGVTPKYSVLPTWMMQPLGLFIPVLKEFKELAYQFEQDYVFDSTKFENRFGIKPTPYAEAVRATVQALRTIKQ